MMSPKSLRRIACATIALAACAVLTQTSGPLAPPLPATDTVAKIKKDGVLKVLTRRGYTTWYEDGTQKAGFEFDLVNRFAESLGVEVAFEIVDTPAELMNRLHDGAHHLGAGAIGRTMARKNDLFTTRGVIERTWQLVRHADAPPFNHIADLAGQSVVVASGSSSTRFLRDITVRHPMVQWNISTTTDSEALLKAVGEQRLDATIADASTVLAMQQHFPKLTVAHTFVEPVETAWAFNPNADPGLVVAAADFLDEMDRHGQIARLEERYFDAARQQNDYDLNVFRKRITDTLPKYRHLFIEAGNRYGVDWRLVAALSYQESLWNPEAISGTGVRGIMQLTKATAQTFNVDRENTAEAIMAGARYLRLLSRRVSGAVDDIDRTWMALASYNVGPGHLDDARRLTRDRGGDADSWRDVKRFLPLLRDPDVYPLTRFGKARGDEAVHLVTRVRSFYDVLVRAERNSSDYNAKPAARTPRGKRTTAGL